MNTKKKVTESLVCLISTVLQHVGSNSYFSFTSSLTCLHDISSPFLFVSILQNNKSSLSSKADRTHILYILRHKGRLPGYWGRL